MRLRISAAVLGLSVLLMSAIVRADSVTYSYVGNAYSNCFGSYSSPCGPQTVSFTVSSSLGDGLIQDNISASVTSFSFSDGTGLTLNQSDSPGAFVVSTDAFGNIIQWSVASLVCSPDPTCSTPPLTEDFFGSSNGYNLLLQPATADFSGTDVPQGSALDACVTDFTPANCTGLNLGYLLNDPGKWTVNTPEPSSVFLLVVGLIGLVALRSRIRINRPANQSD